MKRIRVRRITAANAALVNEFKKNGWLIIIDSRRNPALPPLIEQPWQYGRMGVVNYGNAQKPQQAPAIHVTVIGRPEDGVIHQREFSKTYTRRPSRVGGKAVACRSWGRTNHELERLAVALGYADLNSLLDGLAQQGLPPQPACVQAAQQLNRTVSSVTAKLYSLRKKAIVQGR